MFGFLKNDAAADLQSPLSLDECRERLRGAVDRPWALFGARPVLGWVGQSSFRGRKRIGYGNSYQTRIAARLIAEGASTGIHCRFGLHPVVVAFSTIWFGGVLLLGGTISVFSVVTALIAVMTGTIGTTAQSGRGLAGLMAGVLIPPLMLGFGIALTRFGKWLARDERRFLIAFLCTTLDARETPTSDGAR